MLQFIELNNDKTPKNKGRIDKTTYNSFESFENAGVLLNDDIVLIDFDNDNKKENEIVEYIENSYPTLKVKTDKGVHFYYSKPQNLTLKKSMIDTITVGGFQVDYKTSSKQYAVVKRNGKVRETNRPFSFENIAELPPILYPLTKRKDNLSGMQEHERKK